MHHIIKKPFTEIFISKEILGFENCKSLDKDLNLYFGVIDSLIDADIYIGLDYNDQYTDLIQIIIASDICNLLGKDLVYPYEAQYYGDGYYIDKQKLTEYLLTISKVLNLPTKKTESIRVVY